MVADVDFPGQEGIPLNTDQIFYLIDIAKTHSITQTAERFFMSQQALSFSIKKLEQEFNCTLIERSNKGAQLTKLGHEFVKEMQPFAEHYHVLKEKFAIDQQRLDSYEKLDGYVIVEAHVRTVEPLMLDILSQFRELCPKATVILREKENIEIIEDVVRGSAHIGIIFVPEYILNETDQLLTPEAVTIDKLFSDDFVICAHRNHPIFKRPNLDLKDVSRFDNVLFDANAKMNLAENDVAVEYPPSANQFFSKDISLHKRLLREGKAVSCVTTFEFKKVYKALKELTIARPQHTMRSNITVLLPSNRTNPPEVHIIKHLLDRFDFDAL